MFTKYPSNAVKADGTKIPYEPGKGFNIPSTGNWYFDVSIPDVSTMSIHFAWDANLVATSLNFQDSNFPDFKHVSTMNHDPDAGVDISINNETAGNWITQDPSSAYVPSGAGYTITNNTIAILGGTATGTMMQIGNIATRRRRIKLVVTTVGVFRVHAHGVGA